VEFQKGFETSKTNKYQVKILGMNNAVSVTKMSLVRVIEAWTPQEKGVLNLKAGP
jgi:hypothetical protein